jgi:hypothetical protein
VEPWINSENRRGVDESSQLPPPREYWPHPSMTMLRSMVENHRDQDASAGDWKPCGNNMTELEQTSGASPFSSRVKVLPKPASAKLVFRGRGRAHQEL